MLCSLTENQSNLSTADEPSTNLSGSGRRSRRGTPRAKPNFNDDVELPAQIHIHLRRVVGRHHLFSKCSLVVSLLSCGIAI
jgi:hypothetical protein